MQRLGILALTVVLTLCLARVSPAASGKIKAWERFDFHSKKIEPAKLKNFSSLELKYLRGLVFARYGRVFGEPVIQRYLRSLKWYKPNPKYRVEMLNAIERANMDVIKEAEYRRHKTVQPGDLHFYQNVKIPKEKWGKYSLMQLRLMRGEIEARHGKTFPDEPWLQGFFNERYWYKSNPKYSPSVLNESEKANMDALDAMEKAHRRLRLVPCEMDKYQNKLVEPHMLNGLSLWELRILRNEVYARHGYKFGVPWLREYFAGVSWYAPSDDFKESDLNDVEEKNLKTIVARENKLHAEISSKPITKKLIENLTEQDARRLRNEIYARRGRTFSDKRLQRYFNSFDWYQPKKNFRENSLTSVERRNAQVILAYEKEMASVLRQTAA